VIPKTIHQIWIGPNPPPKAMMETWRRHHPDWDYRLWTEHTIPFPLHNQAQYDAMPSLGGKADIVRYEILLRHGGVYLDADLTCLRPLDPWFLEDPFFAVYESELWRPGLVANGVIGCIPGHPVMEELVTRVHGLDLDQLRLSIPWSHTGPVLLTEVLEQYDSVAKIYPSRLFYPEHRLGAFSEPELCYARHDWYSDWPTLALAMVAAKDTPALWRSLPRFKPHIAGFTIALPGDSTSEARLAVDRVFCGLPGKVLDIGSLSTRAWASVLETAQEMADLVLLAEPNAVLYDFRRSVLSSDADCFTIMDHRGSSVRPVVRMVKADREWRFAGSEPCSIEADGAKCTMLDSCHMLRFTPRPISNPRLIREDEMLMEELARCPDEPEALFYLGQFYEDTRDYERAIWYYHRRATAGGWREQAWQAVWRVARCLELQQAPWPTLETALLEACRLDPNRPEPLVRLGIGYLEHEDYEKASDLLSRAAAMPVPRGAYSPDRLVRQRALEQLNVSAYYAGRFAEGLRAGLDALRGSETVLSRDQIIRNIEFYLDKVEIRSLDD
jgi:tetratricopeptide (TPR) repeat protein